MNNRPDRLLDRTTRGSRSRSVSISAFYRNMNYHRTQFGNRPGGNNSSSGSYTMRQNYNLNRTDADPPRQGYRLSSAATASGSKSASANSWSSRTPAPRFYSPGLMTPLPPIGAGSTRPNSVSRSYSATASELSKGQTVLAQVVRTLGFNPMGQTLSEPVTTKFSSKHENSFAKVGSSCMQGWRINMEDAHSHLLSLPNDKDACFFGVFDGHGGVKVAQYAGNNLHKKIASQASYSKGNFAEALRHGFLALDDEMQKDETMKDELAGTTAVVVLIKNGRIYCANVGDSRAVASVHGEVEQLSFDHKPSNESETRRIIAAGGWVEFNRVNGNLALSRALGDFVFKKNDKKRVEEQIVTANPDVIEKPLTPDHEFMVLACDGIWDVLTNQEVVEFVRNRIAQRMEPEIICEELMTRCLAPDCQAGGLGCDNMTVVLVCFLHGGTYEDLVRKCARPSRGGPAPHLRDYHGGLVFK